VKNRAFEGARRKGAASARMGLPRDPPYKERRTRDGKHGTWSWGLRNAWIEGYDTEIAAKKPGNYGNNDTTPSD
jgi:hypothetical protein